MSGIIGGAGSKSGVIGQTEIDYEEGTWTPTGSGMSTIHKATYVRIGKHCTVYGFWQNVTGSGGDCTGAGLPFSTEATIYPAGVTSSDKNYTGLAVRISNNTWACRNHINDTQLTTGNMNGKYVAFGCTYQIA